MILLPNHTKKIAVFIFIIALSMRMMALWSLKEEKSLFYVSDSYTYIQVAQNILHHGVYSMEISDTPHPDNFRTPLYPLFLLPFIWLKLSFYIPALLQNVIMSLGIAGFFLLSRKIWGDWTAFIGSLLFAMEPFSALISSQILTEAIFTPLFTLGVVLMVFYVKTSSQRYLIYGTSIFALAALARPITFPLAILIPGATLLAPALKKKVRVVHITSSLGIFFLIVSPWLFFNIFKVHTYSVSSVNSMQVYAYHATYFDSWRAEHGASPTDRLPTISLDPINNTFDARAIPPIQAVGMTYIEAHFPEYLVYHFIRIPRLFTDSGYASILNGIPSLHFNYNSTKGGFVDQTSNPRQILQAIQQQPVFIILLIGDLFFIFITLLALFNPFLYFNIHKKVSRETLFILLCISLYAVIASPIGGARFRIPINPFLFLLAVDSILLQFNRHKHA